LNSLVKVDNSDTNNIEIKLVFLADTVKDPATVKDIDGNVYHVVRIGNQLWTVENLLTTKYNDGTLIPLVTDSLVWSTLKTPGLCYYNNWTFADNIKRYGALYNWYAVTTGKLAPAGWHVPDSTEWNTLEKYLIDNGFNYDSTLTGNKVAKALAAQTDWPQSTIPGAPGNNVSTNNRTGFSALPGGYRTENTVCKYLDLGMSGFWWSSTQGDTAHALSRRLTGLNNDPGFSIMLSAKTRGLSVRLLKDTYNQFSLTLSANGGVIVINPDKAAYKSGEVVAVTALADSGHFFWGWSGDAQGTNPTMYVTMNGNKKIRAIFMGIMTDIEGNVYRTVKIGRQVWMVDNLKTTKYNDGTIIPYSPDSAAWTNTIGYCYYNNTTNPDSIKKFGPLYNGNVVLTGKLAPSGWHVPAESEWQVLTNYLQTNGYGWDGKVSSDMIAKALASQTDWIDTTIPGAIGNDQAANNSSGFSALPGGRRHIDGSFMEGGRWAHWWCSNSNPYQSNFSLSNDMPSVWTGAGFSEFGLSVRCVKNQ
jgi:uncharacterized protein (TIGR02145 family)